MTRTLPAPAGKGVSIGQPQRGPCWGRAGEGVLCTGRVQKAQRCSECLMSFRFPKASASMPTQVWPCIQFERLPGSKICRSHAPWPSCVRTPIASTTFKLRECSQEFPRKGRKNHIMFLKIRTKIFLLHFLHVENVVNIGMH